MARPPNWRAHQWVTRFTLLPDVPPCMSAVSPARAQRAAQLAARWRFMLPPPKLCAASKPDIGGERHRCLTVAPLNNACVACECLARDASRSEQDPGVEAVAASITGVLRCLAVGFLRRLLCRPNRAPGLGGALHDCKPRQPRELCVSRRAAGPPRTRSTTRGPSRGARPLLLLAAWLRVSCGFDGSAGESAWLSEIRPKSRSSRVGGDRLTDWLTSDTLWARYQRITVTSGESPSTVNWSLDCEGLVDPLVGGAPYSEMKDVPPGECNLTMTDTYCDGWNGAEWSAPGWTDKSYSANASELLISWIDELDHVEPWTRQLFCTKRVSFRIEEPSPLPPPSPPLPPPSPPWPPSLPLPTAPPEAPQLYKVQGFHIFDVTDNSALINAGHSELPSPALWMLLPLCVLLVAALALFYRRYSRLAQNEANLRASRDRAHFDLKLIVHRVQAGPNNVPNGDDLSSLPDSLRDRRCVSLACATAASLPPGPPSSASPATSIYSAAAASLPRGPPSSSADQPTVPLSWAEADRQFYASPAGKAYLAAHPAHPAHRSTASRLSGAPPPVRTPSSQLQRGMDVTFGRRPSSAPTPFALPPTVGPSGLSAMPHRASSSTPKRPVPRLVKGGPAPPAKSFLKASLRSLRRCTWGKNLALQWTSLTDSERETHMLEAANRAANNEPPPPAPAPAPFPAAASGTELVEFAYAEAGRIWRAQNTACGTAASSTAPLTSAPEVGFGEHPGLPLTTTAGSGVKLVDLMGMAELQDDQAVAALSNYV